MTGLWQILAVQHFLGAPKKKLAKISAGMLRRRRLMAEGDLQQENPHFSGIPQERQPQVSASMLLMWLVAKGGLPRQPQHFHRTPPENLADVSASMLRRWLMAKVDLPLAQYFLRKPEESYYSKSQLQHAAADTDGRGRLASGTPNIWSEDLKKSSQKSAPANCGGVSRQRATCHWQGKSSVAGEIGNISKG